MIRGSGITGQSNNNGNAEHCAKKGGNEYHFYNLRYDLVSGQTLDHKTTGLVKVKAGEPKPKS